MSEQLTGRTSREAPTREIHDPYPENLKKFLEDKARERFPDKKIIILDETDIPSAPVTRLFFQGRHNPVYPIMTYQKRIGPNLENCTRCNGFVLQEGGCQECNGFGQRPKNSQMATVGNVSFSEDYQFSSTPDKKADLFTTLYVKNYKASNSDEDIPELV